MAEVMGYLFQDVVPEIYPCWHILLYCMNISVYLFIFKLMGFYICSQYVLLQIIVEINIFLHVNLIPLELDLFLGLLYFLSYWKKWYLKKINSYLLQCYRDIILFVPLCIYCILILCPANLLNSLILIIYL